MQYIPLPASIAGYKVSPEENWFPFFATPLPYPAFRASITDYKVALQLAGTSITDYKLVLQLAGTFITYYKVVLQLAGRSITYYKVVLQLAGPSITYYKTSKLSFGSSAHADSLQTGMEKIPQTWYFRAFAGALPLLPYLFQRE
ncbi:MAG: hypothetical protein LBS05_07080 [Tannerellaceae bacterium]|nr:hypothetical protein [Tannerellaceae bacterium]